MVKVKPTSEAHHLTETAYDVPFTLLIPADMETGNPDIVHSWLVAPVSLTENVFIPVSRYLENVVFPGYVPENLLEAYNLCYEILTELSKEAGALGHTSIRLDSPVVEITSGEKPYEMTVPLPAAPMPLPEKLTSTFKDAVAKGGVYTLTGTCNITTHVGYPHLREDGQALTWLTWKQKDLKNTDPVFNIVIGRLGETLKAPPVEGVITVDVPLPKKWWRRKPPIEEAGNAVCDFLKDDPEGIERGLTVPEPGVVYMHPSETDGLPRYYMPIILSETPEEVKRAYELRASHLYASITPQGGES